VTRRTAAVDRHVTARDGCIVPKLRGTPRVVLDPHGGDARDAGRSMSDAVNFAFFLPLSGTYRWLPRVWNRRALPCAPMRVVLVGHDRSSMICPSRFAVDTRV
jgi:hypothetical protein